MPHFPPSQVDHLTQSNLDILEALARYRYLTTRQIIALGIASQRSNFYRTMARFNVFTKPLISRSKSSDPNENKGGRIAKEDLIGLTPRGAEFLRYIDPDLEYEIKHLTSKAIAKKHHDHARETVDFHILVDQFADLYGCTVDCFHTYMDHTGANNGANAKRGIDLLRRQTTFLVPTYDELGYQTGKDHKFSADAVFHLTDPTGKGHLYAVEIQRGMDTKRLCTKLRDHYIPALAAGTISEAYGVRDRDAKVLVICENPSLVEQTLKRLNEDPAFAMFHELFAFHTIGELQGTAKDFDIAIEAPKGLAWSISRETREYLAQALHNRPNWIQIMNDDQRFSEHPKRLAKGWRFIGGKVGTIF